MSTSKHPGSLTSSPLAIASAGLLALAVAMGVGRFAFTPILPMMLDDAGLSIADGGLLATANYIGYLCGAIAAMAVRLRHQTALRAGLIVIGVTTLAMGWQVPLGIWLLMRALAGIASAWVLISVSAWSLETLARYQRPWLSSIVFAGVGTGIAGAGLLCLALTWSGAGSSQAWIALGLFSLAVTAAIWPVFRRAGEAGNAAKRGGPAAYRWNADAIRLVVCYGMFGFGYIIPATFLPVMAKKALADTGLFGWAWPVFGVAAALSTLAVAVLIRRVGNRSVWIACHLIMAFGVALPVILPHVVAIFLAALMVGGTFMVITLVAMQEARQVAGDAATVLIAAMTAAFAAGQIAGPLLITYGFSGESGFSQALLVAAALLTASAAALASGNKSANRIYSKKTTDKEKTS
jgi:predicted MFS family arabinose efflux permease